MNDIVMFVSFVIKLCENVNKRVVDLHTVIHNIHNFLILSLLFVSFFVGNFL
jgi:hypothetical protein